MKLQELVAETIETFDLYIPDAYGNGFDKDPIEVGEVLPLEDGSEVEFLGIVKGGKKILVDMNGEKTEMDPSAEGMKIVPKGTKP